MTATPTTEETRRPAGQLRHLPGDTFEDIFKPAPSIPQEEATPAAQLDIFTDPYTAT